LEALTELADAVDLEGGKLLVFSQFVETLRWLAPQLPLPASIYHGGLSWEVRERMLREFADDRSSRVLLVSLRAGGVGLNIPDATHVVLFDRWWNPAVEDQAVSRADRFGRQVPLVIYRYLTVDTVEERIDQVLKDKKEMFTDYVGGASDRALPMLKQLRRVLDLTGEE
jgi:SNF2 family DNA or RNA helicase